MTCVVFEIGLTNETDYEDLVRLIDALKSMNYQVKCNFEFSKIIVVSKEENYNEK
jgi:hypothetical protein